MPYDSTRSQDSKSPFEPFLFPTNIETRVDHFNPLRAILNSLRDNFRRYGKNQVLLHAVSKIRGLSHSATVERVSAERKRDKMLLRLNKGYLEFKECDCKVLKS